MDKKVFQFYAQRFCLYGPILWLTESSLKLDIPYCDFQLSSHLLLALKSVFPTDAASSKAFSWTIPQLSGTFNSLACKYQW